MGYLEPWTPRHRTKRSFSNLFCLRTHHLTNQARPSKLNLGRSCLAKGNYRLDYSHLPLRSPYLICPNSLRLRLDLCQLPVPSLFRSSKPTREPTQVLLHYRLLWLPYQRPLDHCHGQVLYKVQRK